jgi:hypothetical protein
MPIMIRPGAIKSVNGTPMTSGLIFPIETEKITRKSRVVMAGAQIVCNCTLKKRLTSLI